MTPPPVVLLGPQPPSGFSDVGRVLRDLGVIGPVALCTAGWQEGEAEDEALTHGLGVPSVNLALHARSEEVFATDPWTTQRFNTRQSPGFMTQWTPGWSPVETPSNQNFRPLSVSSSSGLFVCSYTITPPHFSSMGTNGTHTVTKSVMCGL